MLRRTTLLMLLLSALAAIPASAQRAWDRDGDRDRDRGWTDRGPPPPPRPAEFELIERQTVDARADKIVFRVGRREGRFEAIKFRAVDDGLLIGGIEIQFANGERKGLDLVDRIRPGEESRVIDLPGDARRVETVTLFKRPSWRPGRVTVELGARESRRGPPGPPPPPPPPAWVLLGTKKASMFVQDYDAVQVGERYGRFRAIRFTAKREDVRFYGARVIYGNGEAENVPVTAQLKEGQSSAPFDLKGRGRYIERVEMKYRSKLTFKGEGVIEVWGLP